MKLPLATAYIDLDAIRHNIRILKNRIPETTRFMAVVKADGYGHGAEKVSKAALESGADRLGVARIEEALELRDAGIDAPILIFGYVDPSFTETVVDMNLTVTVYHPDMAKAFSRQAASLGKPVRIHLKVDTGMGRVGMQAWNNPNISKDTTDIIRLPHLDVEGIYTHFAAADSPHLSYTSEQIKRFSSLLAQMEKEGVVFKIRHAANSGGIISFPSSHFDMVRAGIAMYGCYPANQTDPSLIKLKPAMTLKAIITSVKQVPKDFFVSYGMTYQTPETTVLASVPFGYADGFPRRFSSNGFMLVNGCRAPIVGRVCMDQTMIDVGSVPGEVKPGDEVILLGSQGKESLSAEELSQWVDTINYEIVSALTPRVKKIYSDSTCNSFSSASGSG